MTGEPRPERPRLVAGFLSLSGAELVSKLVMLGTFAYIARVVGPTGFGYLEFAFSVALFGGFLVDQGFGVYGAREIARMPSATERLVTEVTSLRLILAFVVYAGLWVLTGVIDRPQVVEQLVLLYGMGLLALPFMLQWVFQGHDRMRVVALLQIVRAVVFGLAVFALLRTPDVLWPVAVSELCGVGAVVAISMWLYRREFGLPLQLRFSFPKPLIQAGSTIGLSQLFWSVRMYGANILIFLIASGPDAGYFQSAMRLAIGLNAFVWLYFFNLLPSMSRTWQHDRDGFHELVNRALRTAAWLTLAGGVLWVLLAPVIIELAYGSKFLPATETLQWMSGLCILGAVHGHFRFGLIAAEYQRYATACAGIGTVVALALIPLGHALWGIAGAAIALLVGEVAVWLSSYLFGRRYLDLTSPLRHLVRPLIAGVVLVGALLALPAGTPRALRIGLAVVGLAVAVLVAEKRLRYAFARRR